MKRALLFILLCSMVFTGTALAVQSNHGNIGVGVALGLPLGLSGKFWFSNRSAIDAIVGWDFQSQRLALQAGYLYHFPIKDVPTGYLAGYAGLGGLLKLPLPSDERPGVKMIISGRLPIGLEYIYQPISFFAEIDPLLDFYSNSTNSKVNFEFNFGGGVGFRFYF